MQPRRHTSSGTENISACYNDIYTMPVIHTHTCAHTYSFCSTGLCSRSDSHKSEVLGIIVVVITLKNFQLPFSCTFFKPIMLQSNHRLNSTQNSLFLSSCHTCILCTGCQKCNLTVFQHNFHNHYEF